MEDVVVYMIGLASIIVTISALWYLFQTVRIMWGYSSLLAITAVLFSPFVHIFFYFMPKDVFGPYEKVMFKRYFLSIGAIFVLGILAAIVVPSIEESSSNDVVGEVDSSEPWEWDIRSENQEESLALAQTDYDDDKAAQLHYEAIYQVHPDIESLMNSSDFATWSQDGSVEDRENISRILKEGTAAEVIYIFSAFKKDLEKQRAYEYQVKRDNAQAIAQIEYQEKQNRELESYKAQAQRELSRQQEQQLSTQATVQYSASQEPSKRNLTYSERQERDKLKAILSKPVKGSNGDLTRSQREALVALETGQPMPSHSQNTGGAMPASRPTPNNMASCDGAGCWGTDGTRYNKGAGETYFPSTGGVCQNIGGQMQCN